MTQKITFAARRFIELIRARGLYRVEKAALRRMLAEKLPPRHELQSVDERYLFDSYSLGELKQVLLPWDFEALAGAVEEVETIPDHRLPSIGTPKGDLTWSSTVPLPNAISKVPLLPKASRYQANHPFSYDWSWVEAVPEKDKRELREALDSLTERQAQNRPLALGIFKTLCLRDFVGSPLHIVTCRAKRRLEDEHRRHCANVEADFESSLAFVIGNIV